MKLHYKRLGEGEPLVVLHGLLGMLDNWQGPARLLEDGFDCVLVDLRNHGHSPHSNTHDYECMVKDVVALLDELGLKETHLLGHSMGGKVAMLLAQMHPHRVKKLVVADIGPKYYPIHHDKIFKALRAVPLGQIKRRTDAEQYMEPFIEEAAVRQFLMKSIYHPAKNAFAWRFNLDALESNLENVGQPLDEYGYDGETLFIRGGLSRYILDEDWADIKVLFPHAYLTTIEGAGHWLHAEKPEEFATAVRSFLQPVG